MKEVFSEDGRWRRLQEVLTGWLRSRVRNSHDRDEFVSECLLRAWVAFRGRVTDWDLLVSWSLKVMKGVVCSHRRAARRCRQKQVVLDDLSGCCSTEARSSPRWLRYRWLSPLSIAEQQAITMLEAGASLRTISCTMGRTSRGVRRLFDRRHARFQRGEPGFVIAAVLLRFLDADYLEADFIARTAAAKCREVG